jgi:hypothetical protein
MIKILYILTIFFISISTSSADEIDCNQFDKLSAKYAECTALKIKEKSKDLKNTAVENINESKKKFNSSKLKENLIKFKNSKSLTEFKEKIK